MRGKIISREFSSNCLIEALKAKIKNPSVKLYFRPPYIGANGQIRSMHFMWEDTHFSYDFADREYSDDDYFWKYFWHKGYIRQWPKDFARRFTTYKPR